MNNKLYEVAFGLTILICSYFIFARFDLLETIVEWSQQHEQYEVDELFSTSIILVVLLFIFSIKRWRETLQKTRELQNALDEIKVLQGIIPICAYCKKIRNDEGVWNQIELYIHSHANAEFSHGACPECYEKQMRDLDAQ
jgi:preprotein translocase subunit YajC